MESVNRVFQNLLLLNVAFLCVNAFTAFSVNNGKGMPINAGGAFIMIMAAVLLILATHLIFIIVIYFTRSMPMLYVVTVLAGLCTICSLVMLVFKVDDWRRQREHMRVEELRHQDYLAGIGVSHDKQHEIFIKAIAADDSAKVLELIGKGEKVESDDMRFAAELVFVYDKKISFSIFESLIGHRTDSVFEDEIIQVVLYSHGYNRNCHAEHVKIVSLFIKNGLRPLDEQFPIVCRDILQLLLENGVDVNMLTETNYSHYETTESEIEYNPHWTPIMLYCNEFPNYVEETKLLLKYHPDLRYKDENGYSLDKIIEKKIGEYDRSVNSEKITELKKIQRLIR